MTNLAKNLTDTTWAHAGRVAVRVDNAAMTYRALDEASAQVAGLLRERGLRPGDRVGIMMPNVVEVPVVYYGLLRAGGVVVPMNPLLKGREVAYYLSDSGARLIFAWHAFADQARSGAQQAEAECIVLDGVSFPDLLASADPACRPCTWRCCTSPTARTTTPPRCGCASPAAPRCRPAGHRRPGGRPRRGIALAAGSPPPRVVTYSEVAPLAMMLGSEDLLRPWVLTTLGGLATDDERHARMRDTMLAFLQSGGSYKATAEQLMLQPARERSAAPT